jgi:hypothetical protein
MLVPRGVTKLTTAVLFDLPYTYDNPATVYEVKNNFHKLLSQHHHYQQQQQQQQMSSPLSSSFSFGCAALSHISVAHPEAVPKGFVTQYQQATIASTPALTLTSTHGRTNGYGLQGTNQQPTLPCTAFSLRQGSFFNTTSLPQSFELNKSIILQKFTSLIGSSPLYRAYLSYTMRSGFRPGSAPEFYAEIDPILSPLTQSFFAALYNHNNNAHNNLPPTSASASASASIPELIHYLVNSIITSSNHHVSTFMSTTKLAIQ